MKVKTELIKLLKQGQAFKPLEKALEEVPAESRNLRVNNQSHSIWELLEHMRIAQKDILEFMFNEDYEKLNWPEDYWPSKDIEFTDEHWNNTLELFRYDLGYILDWLNKSELDLTIEIPHAPGYTYLGEILLIADHNAYHTGQIEQIIKILNS